MIYRLLLLFTLLSAPLMAQDQKEQEPNNDPDKATIVELDRIVSFQLTPKHDVDYFEVISPGDGVLRFAQKEHSKAHGWVHRWWISPETGETVRPRESDLRVTAGSKWILGVSSDQFRSSQVASDEVIQGEFSFSPEKFESEPNETIESAQPVDAGESFSFSLMPRLDADVFSIVSPGNGVLRYIDEKRTDAHGWVRVDWILENGASARANERDIRVIKGQKVYLKIRSHTFHSSAKSSDEIITGKIVFEPELFPSEPNNTPEEAVEVTVGETFEFTLNPRLDVDVFTVSSPGRGTLTYVDEKRTESHLWVYPFWLEEDGKGFRAGLRDRRVEKGETVFLGIRSHHFDSSAKGSNEIIRGKLVFAPEIAVSEPNDSAETAETVELEESVRFTLTPRHDRDFFRLKSPAKGTLRFELSQPSKDHQTYPSWINPSSGEVMREGKWDRSIEKGETTLFVMRSNHFAVSDVASNEMLQGSFFLEPERVGGEPNDTADLAQPMNSKGPTGFTLTPRHDRDFFQLPESPVDGMVQVRRVDEGTHHPKLFPWWGEGNFRGGLWNTRVSKGESATLGLRSSQFTWDETASSEPMQIVAEFIAEPLGNEPGDTTELATKTEIGSPFPFALMPSGDRDYFAFTSSRAGWLKVSQEEDGSRAPWFWWERKESGEKVENTAAEVKEGEIIFLGVRADRFRSSWAADEVMTAVVQYVEAPETPESSGHESRTSPKRKWTFRINRSPEP
ncbi:MAG: hypothetical protein AAGF67_07120 [Verrucomicrobiota bacterium]